MCSFRKIIGLSVAVAALACGGGDPDGNGSGNGNGNGNGNGDTDTEPGEIVWTHEFDGNLTGSPVVVDGMLYITTDSRGHAAALDAATGDVVWDMEDAEPNVAQSFNVVDGTAYYGVHDQTASGIMARDAATGEEIWDTRDLEGLVVTARVEGSVAVRGGEVYVPWGKTLLAALSAETGERLHWEAGEEELQAFVIDGLLETPPTVVDGTVYVATQDNSVYAFDASTGDEKWTFSAPGDDGVFWPVTVEGGLAYVLSEAGLHALDVDTGEREWFFESERQLDLITGPYEGTMATVSDGVVYLPSDEHGALIALDADTGDEIWQAPDFGDPLFSSPTVAGGVVFASPADSELRALDASTGELQWGTPLGDVGSTSSPVVVGGIVYTAISSGHVYAIDAGVDGSSEDSRVLHGTTSHHHAWADQSEN